MPLWYLNYGWLPFELRAFLVDSKKLSCTGRSIQKRVPVTTQIRYLLFMSNINQFQVFEHARDPRRVRINELLAAYIATTKYSQMKVEDGGDTLVSRSRLEIDEWKNTTDQFYNGAASRHKLSKRCLGGCVVVSRTKYLSLHEILEENH